MQSGADLRLEIELFAKQHDLQAGYIATCVGSLDRTTLRLANQQGLSSFPGPMEIVSLVGSLSPDGVQLHQTASDKSDAGIGGHTVPGCRVSTTAEIVLGEAHDMQFHREIDPPTTYRELTVKPREG